MQDEDLSSSSLHSTMTVPEAADLIKSLSTCSASSKQPQQQQQQQQRRRVHFHGADDEEYSVIEYHHEDQDEHHVLYDDEIARCWYSREEHQQMRKNASWEARDAQDNEQVMKMLHPHSAYSTVLETVWKTCQYDIPGESCGLPLDQQAALERLFEEEEEEDNEEYEGILELEDTDEEDSIDSTSSCSLLGVNPHWYRLGLEKYILVDTVGRDVLETRTSLNRLMERLQDDFVWSCNAELERAMARACQTKTKPFAIWAQCRAQALWQEQKQQ